MELAQSCGTQRHYASAHSSASIGNPAGVLPSWGPKDLSEFRTEVFAIFAVLAVGVKKKKNVSLAQLVQCQTVDLEVPGLSPGLGEFLSLKFLLMRK